MQASFFGPLALMRLRVNAVSYSAALSNCSGFNGFALLPQSASL
jgi:hypothetical protein